MEVRRRIGRLGIAGGLLPAWVILCSFVLLVGEDAQAVAIDWVMVGAPGNACDTQSQGCFGSVGSPYRISRYETTNAQYAEFLNAVAQADPLVLYNTNMSSSFGGITRSGSSGSYAYAPIAGRADMPVNFVTYFDAMRFANWLNNGQGAGGTETGSYTLLGGTAQPSNGLTVTRNSGASLFLPSEDEWHKAAYFDPLSSSFLAYPAGSDAQMVCAAPGSAPNTGNCGFAVGDLTNVGSYPGAISPNGTFDQGGNVWEWNELITNGSDRGIRGGSFKDSAGLAAASFRTSAVAGSTTLDHVGFRVASAVPEPGTGLLLMTGLLGLAWGRRARAWPSS